MPNKVLHTDSAPKAIGPYSQAIATEEIVYVSGQIAFVPETGALIDSSIEDATRQTIENIKAILAVEGVGLANVVKTTVLLKDIADFAGMNTVYAQYFGENPPARSSYAVGSLPRNALVEIEVIAHR